MRVLLPVTAGVVYQDGVDMKICPMLEGLQAFCEGLQQHIENLDGVVLPIEYSPELWRRVFHREGNYLTMMLLESLGKMHDLETIRKALEAVVLRMARERDPDVNERLYLSLAYL